MGVFHFPLSFYALLNKNIMRRSRLRQLLHMMEGKYLITVNVVRDGLDLEI